MKPKEYVEKFALNTANADVDGALNQLRMDFQAQFEFHDINGNMNITMFDNIERQIKDKYNGIRNKSATGVFTDETWEIFKKRVLNHVRGTRFKSYYDAKRRKWEDRNAQYREKEDMRRRMFANMFFGAIKARLAAEEGIFVRAARIELGIDADTKLTHDSIMDAWRGKVRHVHTDKVITASTDAFEIVMKAREILLNSIGE